MANELLKSPEGDAVPQNLKDGVSVSASDLDGDDTVWEIFDDPAQGGGSTLQDVVDAIGATLEVTDDGSFNATVSGTVGLEADDGSGTVEGIQQTNNALDVYLSAQNGNFSVDLQNDAVGLASETTLSNIASALSSNGGDVLQVEQQTPIQIEAENSGGTVGSIQRTDNNLNVEVIGQGGTNLSINLENDNTSGSGLASENTLTSLSEALISETDDPDTLRVQVENVDVNVVKEVSQVAYQGTKYPIQFAAGRESSSGDYQIQASNSNQKIVVLSYNIVTEGNHLVQIQDTDANVIDFVKGESSETDNVSRDPAGPIGETGVNADLTLTLSGNIPTKYQISYIIVTV